MKGIRLNTATFERCLKKDLLFVQYFNAFLTSPAFTRKLEYDEDTQLMSDISERKASFSEDTRSSLKQKTKKTDRLEESKFLVDWCKTNRLPFFLKSRHYSEYKLCNNLLSSNDNRQFSAVQFSSLSQNRYSSSVASIPSASLKENHARSFSQTSLKSWPQISDDFERMQSRPTSLPNFNFLQDRISSPFITEDLANPTLQPNRPTTSGNERVLSMHEFDGDIEKELEDLCIDETEKKQSVFEFENESVFDKQTECDVMSISIKRKLTLHELKIASVGSIQGMERFKAFLAETTGYQLLQFWLDAESYKHKIQGWQAFPIEKKEQGIRLFRVMHDKYKHHLTTDAKEQIKLAVQSEGYSESLFLRAQIDILKRLRSYWLPRFLVHIESKSATDENFDNTSSRLISAMSFFPSISVVKTLPTLGHVLCEEAREHSFNSLYKFRESSRVKSGYLKKVTFKLPDESMDQDRFLQALHAERETGSPFIEALKSREKTELLHLLQFWLNVDDFIQQNDKQEDRLYRLCNAWNIFNKYISNGNTLVTNDQKAVESVRVKLSAARDITKETAVALFGDLQLKAAESLRESWEDCQEEERNKLTSISREPSNVSGQSSERHVTDHKVEFSPTRWIKRYPGSSESERKQRLQTALSLAEECNISRQSSREIQQHEKVKKKKRKNRKGVKFQPEDSDSENKNATLEEEKPQFVNLVENKEVVLAFKQFIQNEEGRDILNNLSMFLDIETFNDIHHSKRLQRQQQSATIYRTYFDSSSRRAVLLPDDMVDKVEDEIPSTPILGEARNTVLPDLETCFQKFYKKARHIAIKSREATMETLRTTSEGNKPDTMESFRSYHSHVNTPKVGKKKRKGTGRIPPSKDDRVAFLEAVQACSGRITKEMDSFRRYLLVKDDPGIFPRLEKDLLFYLEVQKFKDLYPFLDETSLNRKVEVIIDVFLDSATPPWLQIDLSSEQAAKVMQKAQQYYSMMKRVPREQKDPFIFDDAHALVLKELLPYWAGFCKQHRNNNELPEFSLTKKEREKRKRYRDFQKAASTNEKAGSRPKTPGLGESKNELTFTVARGFKWKEAAMDLESILSESTGSKMSGSRKSSAFSIT